VALARIPNHAIYKAGEYYARSRLLLLGYEVQHRQDSPASVIRLVLKEDGREVAELITRTTATRKLADGWTMGENDQGLNQSGRFYALINLRDPTHPVSYILHSSVVGDVVAKQHTAWHATPRRRGEGQKHQTELRAVRNVWRRMEVPGYPDGWLERYREAWHLLGDGS
jgi:hypothetical protein